MQRLAYDSVERPSSVAIAIIFIAIRPGNRPDAWKLAALLKFKDISVSIPAKEILIQRNQTIQVPFNSLTLIWYLGLMGLFSLYKKTVSFFKANIALSMKLSQAKVGLHTLKGLIPICVHCKRVKIDTEYWEEIDLYVSKCSKTEFSHGLCPEKSRGIWPLI